MLRMHFGSDPASLEHVCASQKSDHALQKGTARGTPEVLGMTHDKLHCCAPEAAGAVASHADGSRFGVTASRAPRHMQFGHRRTHGATRFTHTRFTQKKLYSPMLLAHLPHTFPPALQQDIVPQAWEVAKNVFRAHPTLRKPTLPTAAAATHLHRSVTKQERQNNAGNGWLAHGTVCSEQPLQGCARPLDTVVRAAPGTPKQAVMMKTGHGKLGTLRAQMLQIQVITPRRLQHNEF